MKKLICVRNVFRTLNFIIIISGTAIVSGQSTKEMAKPIPDDINKIVLSSCMPCHGNDGGIMAKNMVNFSKWTEYEVGEASNKAQKVCSVLKKGLMPPKSFRESKPQSVPTAEQVDLICKWAESIKLPEKGK